MDVNDYGEQRDLKSDSGGEFHGRIDARGIRSGCGCWKGNSIDFQGIDNVMRTKCSSHFRSSAMLTLDILY